MAESIEPRVLTAPETSNQTDLSTVGRPQEQLEIQDQSDGNEIEYPKGAKLIFAMLAINLAIFLVGLDLTIIAVTVPSLTNEFNTIEDIGWYSSTYGVFLAAFSFFFGKMYTVYSVKWTFIVSVSIFEVGSLMCTVAQNSPTFILGRAIAGLGAGGLSAGAMVIIAQCAPVSKRPLWFALAGASQSVGLISSPPIGGALIDGLSWRACFGMNLPLGVFVVAITAWGFQELEVNPDRALAWKEKLKRIDLIGTGLFVPAVTVLLIALQWGGIRYGWGDWRIIILLVSFSLLFATFCWLQYYLKDKATIPPRILKNRSVFAASWFSACCNGTLAVTEYYMAIYFQGVKGFSATKSGVMILPMIVGLLVSMLLSGLGTARVGYYTPFMIATTVLAPIAAGLITTVDLDESLVKVLCYLGFLGIAIGAGVQAPVNAINTVLPLRDIPIGLAISTFGGGMGSSLFIAASAALFQNRLVDEIGKSAPGTNITQISHVGLSDLRTIVGRDRLRDVLLGYDEAVTQTLYIPVALTCATILGTVFVEWRSVKQKQS